MFPIRKPSYFTVKSMDKATVTDIIRPLKGAPLSILITLLLFQGSMTAKELELSTGYSDKPITQGLAFLEMKGYLQNNGLLAGWSIKQGQQLPLPLQQLVPTLNHPNAAANNELPTGYPQEDRNFSDYRRISDPFVPPPPPNIEGTNQNMAAEGGDNPNYRRNSDSSASNYRRNSDPYNHTTYNICRQFGVGTKKAYELAQLPWATPHYITTIFNQYRGRPDLSHRDQTRYAIQAISDGDDPPPAAETCPDCGHTINPRLGFCTNCAVQS